MSHHHGLSCRGALIEHRSPGDFQSGEVGDEGLEVEQSLQSALGNLGLVGRVSGIPARVLENGALNHGRRVGAVVALSDEVGKNLIGGSNAREFGQRGGFAQRPRNGHRTLAANVSRHGGIDERIKRRLAQDLEHSSLLRCVRPIVATGKRIGWT